MALGYALKEYESKTMARAYGKSLPISFKHSLEVCNFIRNKKMQDAKKMLQKVIEGKMAVPYRRYNFDLGHKKKIGPGRYPIKTSAELLRLLEDVEANAQFKGLNAGNLVISFLCAKKPSIAWRYGRKRRRKMKRTDVEIVVKEK